MEKLADQRDDAERAYRAIQNPKYVRGFGKDTFELPDFFSEYEKEWWDSLSDTKHQLIGKDLWENWDEISASVGDRQIVKKTEDSGVYKWVEKDFVGNKGTVEINVSDSAKANNSAVIGV